MTGGVLCANIKGGYPKYVINKRKIKNNLFFYHAMGKQRSRKRHTLKSAEHTEREWHLYSAFVMTCALTFIGVNYFTGTAQVMGAAMGPVVGGFLGMSTDWKNQSYKIHLWVITISLVATFASVIVAKLLLLRRDSAQH